MIAQRPLTESRFPPDELIRIGQRHCFIAFARAVFGTVELTLDSPDARRVEVHLGEKLAAPGRLDREPPGSIRYRCIPLALRPGRHTYRVEIPPDERNTGAAAVLMPAEIGEVYPFRYCELVGHAETPARDDLTQVMVHYPFDDEAAHFVCDSDELNRVWELCKYSIKATTFCGVYVDGDRERIAYEADAYINQLGHYCVDASYGMGRATLERLIERPTWPTEWLLHMPLMALAEYLYSGDRSFLRQAYADLKLRTLSTLARDDGLISTQTGGVTDELLEALHLGKPMRDIVDWPPGSFTERGTGERDGCEMTELNTVVNAFHVEALRAMSVIAATLRKKREAAAFTDQAARVTAAMNGTLVDSRGLYVDGEGSCHASLHANMFPLAFGLVPPEREADVLAHIRSRGMACSVYGAQHLLDALYLAGDSSYAFELMTATHDRSWLNMLAAGSTMTLEAWDWKYKNNLDWNHAWGAAPANVIPRRLMGIRPLEPGFRVACIQPQPAPLAHASCRHPTPLGPIDVEVEATGNESYGLRVQIPDGMHARIAPPIPDATHVRLNRRRRVLKKGWIEVGPGEHCLDPV